MPGQRIGLGFLLAAVVFYVIVLSPFSASYLLVTVREVLPDTLMRITTDSNYFRVSDPAYRFVAIDDETRQKHWNTNRLFTDRRHLRRVLETVLSGQPKYLYIDVELTRGTPGDELIIDLIKSWSDRGTGDTTILLPRTSHLGSATGEADMPQFAPTPLDEIVRNAPNIHWSTSRLIQDADGVARQASFWMTGCDRSGAPVFIPSPSLLIALLEKEGPETARAVLKAFTEAVGSDCRLNKTRLDLPETALGPRIENALDHYLASPGRIMFALPALDLKTPSRLTTPKRRRALRVLPAHAVENYSPVAARDNFRGLTVIVGGDHADSTDRFMTPIETLPGGLIIANAMNTTLAYDPVMPTPWPTALGLVLVTLYGVFAHTHRARTTSGRLLSAGFWVLALALWIGLFREGIWVDIAAIFIFWDLRARLQRFLE